MNDVHTLKKFLESRWGIRWTEQHAKDVSHLLTKSPSGGESEPRQTLEPLVNGETYFFRYPIYLEILQELMKSRVEKDFQSRFRVLCAGCSTGEEAYSIAFSLLETARRIKCKLEIRGVDLRIKAVETARAAVYFKWSLRNMGKPDQKRFLLAREDGSWEVAEPYRSAVEFQVHNLVEPLEDRPFDAVLLCNVLIYMHETAVRKVYHGLETCISGDSILITGPADPAPENAWFLQREFRGWPIYSRKPSVASPARKVEVLEIPEEQRHTPPAVQRHRRVAAPAVSAPSVHQDKKAPSATRAAAPAEADEMLWRAWAQGKLDSASDQIRQKVFYEPEHPLWRFLNGVILMEHGWLRKSRREIDKANTLLNSYSADQLISGLCTVEELRRMIDFWRQQNG